MAATLGATSNSTRYNLNEAFVLHFPLDSKYLLVITSELAINKCIIKVSIKC